MRLLTRLYPDLIMEENSGLVLYLSKDLLDLSDDAPLDSPHYDIDYLSFGLDDQDKPVMETEALFESEDYVDYEFSCIVIAKDSLILMIIQEDYIQKFTNKNFKLYIKIHYEKPESYDSPLFTGQVVLNGFIGDQRCYTNSTKFSISNKDQALNKSGFLINSEESEMSNEYSVAMQGLSFSRLSPLITFSGKRSDGQSGIFMINLFPSANRVEALWIDPARNLYFSDKNSLTKVIGYQRIHKTLYGDIDITDSFGIEGYQIPNMSSQLNYVIEYKNNIIRTLVVKDIPTYINGSEFSGTTQEDKNIVRKDFIKKNLSNFDKNRYVVIKAENFILYIDYYSRIISVYNVNSKYFSRYLMENFDIYESLYGFVVKVDYDLDSNFKRVGNYKGYYIKLSDGQRINLDHQPKFRLLGHLYTPYYQKSIPDNIPENFTYKDSKGIEHTGYWNKTLLKDPNHVYVKYLNRLIYMP